MKVKADMNLIIAMFKIWIGKRVEMWYWILEMNNCNERELKRESERGKNGWKENGKEGKKEWRI